MQDQHQHDMVAELRKTVKLVVSEYHMNDQPVTLENETARRLVTMITVILKHGLIGASRIRFSSNFVLKTSFSVVNGHLTRSCYVCLWNQTVTMGIS